MKTTRFFPTLASVAAAVTVGFIAKMTADKVKGNGGVRPTLDMLRNGAAAVIDATKQHPAVTWAADTVTGLRDRIVANDEHAPIGATDDDLQVVQATPAATIVQQDAEPVYAAAVKTDQAA